MGRPESNKGAVGEGDEDPVFRPYPDGIFHPRHGLDRNIHPIIQGVAKMTGMKGCAARPEILYDLLLSYT